MTKKPSLDKYEAICDAAPEDDDFWLALSPGTGCNSKAYKNREKGKQFYNAAREGWPKTIERVRELEGVIDEQCDWVDKAMELMTSDKSKEERLDEWLRWRGYKPEKVVKEILDIIRKHEAKNGF